MNDVSIVTLVKNRAGHLDRLLEGVARSDEKPREIVIVDMDDEAVSPRAIEIDTTLVRFRSSGLPLAAARNRGAQVARGRHLLFLDVDCIPQKNLVGMMHQALTRDDHLICGEVRYLGPGGALHADDDALHSLSIAHSHRTFPQTGSRQEPNAGLFWSLLFGIRRDTFDRLQGFDESYAGYGAEDTDFGFRANAAGVPLVFIGGTGAFHQYHGVIDPPLQHFADIVRNASRFHRIWGLWPMQDWLAAFEERGLIAKHADQLEVLRQPTPAEIDAARSPPDIYF